MPEKGIVTLLVQEALKNATTLEDFISQMQREGYDVYSRSGVPHGIIGKRKYRFASLGISLERLRTMDRATQPERDLSR